VKSLKYLAVILACIGVQACASRPDSPPGPAQPIRATAAPAAGAQTSSPADHAATPDQAHTLYLDDKTLTQDEVNRLLSQGYKPKKGRGDDILYCRSEQQLGTHFDKRICLTADQIKTAMQDSRDIAERLQRNLGNPQKP